MRTSKGEIPAHMLDSYVDRPAVDEEYYEALLIARRILKRTPAELEAFEALNAAATAIEHPHPTMDAALARKLRLAANLLLNATRHRDDLIREVNELDGTYAAADEAATEEV